MLSRAIKGGRGRAEERRAGERKKTVGRGRRCRKCSLSEEAGGGGGGRPGRSLRLAAQWLRRGKVGGAEGGGGGGNERGGEEG